MTDDPTSDFPLPQSSDLPIGRLDARRAHLLAEITPSSAERIGRASSRRTRRLVALAAAIAILAVGTAVASTTVDWLFGKPAPPSVVENFRDYANQLGFDPEPGKAVEVASNDDTILFATLNSQGGYCLAVSAPWKRPEKLGDGGTCLNSHDAAAALVAGVVGVSSTDRTTYVVAGRAADRLAATVELTDPSGNTVRRSLGSSGFFVLSIEVRGAPCADGDWNPDFILRESGGTVLSSSRITLARATHSPDVCILPAPHP